jgi:hypothetical protein
MFEKFCTDPSFDFETRTLLGGIHYGAGDSGEMLTAVADITDGDATSWVTQWRALAERIQAIGEASLRLGTGSVRVQPTCAPRCTTPPHMCSWMEPRTPTRS